MVSTSATKARAKFADLLNRVIYRSEPVVINRHGKPCAAIIPIHALASVERLMQFIGEDRALKALEDEQEGKEPHSDEEVRRQLGLPPYKEEPEE